MNGIYEVTCKRFFDIHTVVRLKGNNFVLGQKSDNVSMCCIFNLKKIHKEITTCYTTYFF